MSLFSNLEMRRPNTVKIFLYYVSMRINFVDFRLILVLMFVRKFRGNNFAFFNSFFLFSFYLSFSFGLCRYFVLRTKYKASLCLNFVR